MSGWVSGRVGGWVSGRVGGWVSGCSMYVYRFADNHLLMVEEVSEFCVVSVVVSEPARVGELCSVCIIHLYGVC